MVDQIESCSPNTLVQCRICHDEDEDLNMDTPCSCSGTLQYAHRICVQRWCNEKGDTTCEICQQQFKGYTAPQAPLFHYRGNWEIPRVGFNNHQFIALFPANHEFLDFNFEYSAPSTRSRVFIRIVAIISGNNISEKAYEDGRTMVESKTADLRSQIRRKGDTNQASSIRNPWKQSDQTQSHSNHETQLKQSRDVALATAAKSKLLLRELKTVKADLAFAKARCAQLEEENKLLREREGSDKGLIRDDDDLVLISLLFTYLNLQKMVYPYLPEEMRKPSTFKWMLQNPEYRQRLEEMLNNMGGGTEWDSRMMDTLKNFDLNSPAVKQQFDQIGLSPEEVISKIMANPDVAMAFQNPRVQAAIMDCSQNPMSIAKYQNDKEASQNGAPFNQGFGNSPGSLSARK
ncbi:unnamed protein product [Vicia faba]|uniref:Protein TIC 40, chloroplastic n=1 Tax=Vicia faba TaxID=3906 RepID=A0AAV0YVS5_VICFA|nr:unnamed protein product [Vicia faba]